VRYLLMQQKLVSDVSGMVKDFCCHFHFWSRMGWKMLASKSWHLL